MNKVHSITQITVDLALDHASHTENDQDRHTEDDQDRHTEDDQDHHIENDQGHHREAVIGRKREEVGPHTANMKEVTITDHTHLITAAEATDVPIIIGTDPPHQEIGTIAKSIAGPGQENTPRANEIGTTQTERTSVINS